MGPHAHPQLRLNTLLRRTGTACLLLMIQGELLAQQVPYYYGQTPQSAYNQPSYPPQQYSQQTYPQQPGYPQQADLRSADQSAYQPTPQGLTAPQLEQLVAPIALYPDTLVAQILTAATYPSQVVDADRWRRTQFSADPFDLAVSADAQPWDPSIKSLTAFPQVLAMMNQNLTWTTSLGATYYNQPQDVLQAVQVLRQRAESAGSLQNSPQLQVSYDQGSIVLAPANPQVLYVPTYNPWTVYGAPLAPYPGFSLLGALGSFFGSAFSAGVRGGIGASPVSFGLGIATAAFSHMPWGWLGWGLSWLAHAVLFHQSTYFTHSTMVADWGLPHGGARAFADYRDYRGAPVNNRAPANYRTINDYRGPYTHPTAVYGNRQAFNNDQNLSRTSTYAGLRPGEAYRPNGATYGSSLTNNTRPTEPYARPSPSYAARPAEPNFARNEAPRANNSFTSRGYESFGREEHFKAPKSFIAGKAPRGFDKPPKPPKVPKGSGGHSGGKHHLF